MYYRVSLLDDENDRQADMEACPWETEIAKVGLDSKIGQHTRQVSRPGRLLLTGTEQGYFLDSQSKYLTKYLYGPSTISDAICILQLFLYL